MSDFFCWDREGRPITLEERSRLGALPGYSRIALTRLKNGLLVSTTWIGTDFHARNGRPKIYATMVYDDVGGGWVETPGPLPLYSSERAARRGHARVVAKMKKLPRRKFEYSVLWMMPGPIG